MLKLRSPSRRFIFIFVEAKDFPHLHYIFTFFVHVFVTHNEVANTEKNTCWAGVYPFGGF